MSQTSYRVLVEESDGAFRPVQTLKARDHLAAGRETAEATQTAGRYLVITSSACREMSFDLEEEAPRRRAVVKPTPGSKRARAKK